MKTKIFSLKLFALLVLGCSIFCDCQIAAASESSAAEKSVDLNMHFKFDYSDLDVVNAAPVGKKSNTNLGVVLEEKNTSTSQQKALINPYHRTVSTGISF